MTTAVAARGRASSPAGRSAGKHSNLYLLAHHDPTGKPLLQPRSLSIGQTGGLLAELMLGRSVSLRHDGAAVPEGAPVGAARP